MPSADPNLSAVVVDKISVEECRACFDAAANSTESGISAFTINMFAMSVRRKHSLLRFSLPMIKCLCGISKRQMNQIIIVFFYGCFKSLETLYN